MRLLCGLPVVVLCCAVGAAQDTDTPTDEAQAAQEKVLAFEQPLVKQLMDAPHDRDVQQGVLADMQPSVQAFFAAQKTSAEKIAAMDLLDNRYVYIVTRETAAKVLGPLIRDDDPAVRARAAHAIGYNGCGKAYADELIAMLDGDPPSTTIRNVIFAMGRSGHEAFVPYLVKLLDHEQTDVRISALSELHILAPDKAYEHLVRLLDDESDRIRMAVVQVLPQYDAPRERRLRVIELLEAKLADKNHRVREATVRALGVMESRDSVERIKPLLEDENRNVRRVAGEVLEKLRGN